MTVWEGSGFRVLDDGCWKLEEGLGRIKRKEKREKKREEATGLGVGCFGVRRPRRFFNTVPDAQFVGVYPVTAPLTK